MFHEEFTVGRRFVTGTRTVTAADVRQFAELSGDRNAIHLDDTAARDAGFPGVVAHGALGLSIATGLASGLELTAGTLIALAAITWRFRAPVRPGDRVTLALAVTSTRTTGKPDRGVVVLAAELRNQDGVVVQDGEFVEIVKRRPAHG